MHNRHQRTRHSGRVFVLDDVAAVNDAGGALLRRIVIEGDAPASLAFGGESLDRLLLLGQGGGLYGLPDGLLGAAPAGVAETLFDDTAPVAG